MSNYCNTPFGWNKFGVSDGFSPFEGNFVRNSGLSKVFSLLREILDF